MGVSSCCVCVSLVSDAPLRNRCQKFFGGWIIFDPAFPAREVIELNDFRAVASICEFQPKHFRVLLRLLKSLRGGIVF